MWPSELILIVFGFVEKITDKRTFSRTCKRVYELTKKLVVEAESEYFYYPIGSYTKYSGTYVKWTDNLMARHTWTLCKDGYFDMIPEHYYCKGNELLCKGLILSGNVNLLIKALDCCGALNYETCLEAAKYGYLDIIEWGISKGCFVNYQVFVYAAANNHQHVLKWANDNGWEMFGEIGIAAARNGHLEMLQLIISYDGMITTTTCYRAAECGHFEIVKWLLEKGYHMNMKRIIEYVIKFGDYDMMLWCIDKGGKMNKRTYENGLRYGNLKMVQYVKNCGYDSKSDEELLFSSDEE